MEMIFNHPIVGNYSSLEEGTVLAYEIGALHPVNLEDYYGNTDGFIVGVCKPIFKKPYKGVAGYRLCADTANGGFEVLMTDEDEAIPEFEGAFSLLKVGENGRCVDLFTGKTILLNGKKFNITKMSDEQIQEIMEIAEISYGHLYQLSDSVSRYFEKYGGSREKIAENVNSSIDLCKKASEQAVEEIRTVLTYGHLPTSSNDQIETMSEEQPESDFLGSLIADLEETSVVHKM